MGLSRQIQEAFILIAAGQLSDKFPHRYVDPPDFFSQDKSLAAVFSRSQLKSLVLCLREGNLKIPLPFVLNERKVAEKLKQNAESKHDSHTGSRLYEQPSVCLPAPCPGFLFFRPFFFCLIFSQPLFLRLLLIRLLPFWLLASFLLLIWLLSFRLRPFWLLLIRLLPL